MKDEFAFIGDVHGCLPALENTLNEIILLGVPKAVLLGDYVNKGPESSEVLDLLVSWDDGELELYPLLGNHDQEFLNALESGDVRPLLRQGGAPTIRSYVGGNVGPDAYRDFNLSVPDTHRQFLRRLPNGFYSDGVVATHRSFRAEGATYRVSGHTYVGNRPKIGQTSARIDTGCGSGGLLTTFLWPSRDYLQFTERGLREVL